MPNSRAKNIVAARHPMLLLESDALLRRTVSLTAHSLGMCEVWEASNRNMATDILKARKFAGAILALDFDGAAEKTELEFLDEVRRRARHDQHELPLAVMLPVCDFSLLKTLREHGVTRVILKPFRARAVLDTFAEFVRMRDTTHSPA